MNNTRDYLYWRLGQAGVSFEDVGKLKSEATSRSHGHARGEVPVPGTAITLFYDPGMDGWDSRYGLQEAS